MESYNDILAAIHNCDTLEENAIDCRLIIEHGSLVMGFGYPDRFQLSKDSNYVQGCYVNDKGVMLSSNILYELKKISGYYNYFSIEELEDDYLIKKYGIPHYYYAYENGGEDDVNSEELNQETGIKDISKFFVNDLNKVVIKKSRGISH